MPTPGPQKEVHTHFEMNYSSAASAIELEAALVLISWSVHCAMNHTMLILQRILTRMSPQNCGCALGAAMHFATTSICAGKLDTADKWQSFSCSVRCYQLDRKRGLHHHVSL
eukprot:221236-Pelagomonas_calceolata.AAC.2